MSHLLTEIESFAKLLSEERARSLRDYAEYLAEKEEEENWDRVLEKCAGSPKFEAHVKQVEREIPEGHSEPMDFDRL